MRHLPGIVRRMANPFQFGLDTFGDVTVGADGAPHSQARVLREQFRLLQGEELIRVYGKGEGAVKAFCSNCGSSLFGGDWPDGSQVSIRMGAFDVDPGIRPQFHTFVADRAPWDTITDDLPQYPERRT